MKRRFAKSMALLLMMAMLPMALSAEGVMDDPTDFDYSRWADTDMDSYRDLSIEALRAREYGSRISLVGWLGQAGGENEYQASFSIDGTPTYNTYMAAYMSDGNRVYTRVDVPATPMPEGGYPVAIFLHGWVGEAAAPDYTMNYYANSYYGDIIDAYADAGFVVLMPALRGHATVDGVPGEGIEFLTKFDNGSYSGPLFYTIDTLNLIDGLYTLNSIDWSVWGFDAADSVKVDLSSINLAGHSQNGDALLNVLAVSGEGSSLDYPVSSGAIWSGCFPDRITQCNTYGLMEQSTEAFKAGSQEEVEWNGTPVGSDGSVNPNFVFGFPPDWIGTIDPAEWGWQADYFGKSVEERLVTKFGEMYRTLNNQFADVDGISFEVVREDDGRVLIEHDPLVEDYSFIVSGFNYPQYLVDEDVIMHFSDQDFYSFPEWNYALEEKINAAGGNAKAYLYPENSHSITKSSYEWFDPDNSAIAGRRYAIERDIALFSGRDPDRITYP